MYGLIVEDETLVAQNLCRFLEPHGYVFDHIQDGKDIFPHLKQYEYEFMILDIRLRDENALEYVESIKNNYPSIKIVVISAMTDAKTVLRSLEMGVDEYIRKPFLLDEVKYRLDLVRQRNVFVPKPKVYQIQGIVFDYAESKLNQGERNIHLTKTERNLLKVFVDNAGKTLSQTQIIHSLWGKERGLFDKINLFNVHLSNLRKKFKEMNSQKIFIINISQAGYKLIM